MSHTPDLETMLARIRAHKPVVRGPSGRAAATALILHDHPSHGPEILFIQRTERDGDRWSGQMALPGGRQEDGDADRRETAIRETEEEVGVRLREPIGRLDDIGGRSTRGTVSTFVFELDVRQQLHLEPSEVDDAVWIPVSHLAARRHRRPYFYRGLGPFPAIRYEGYTIWGLTHQIITRHFLRLIR